MKTVTFNPQAWFRNNAIDIDPQGDTVFTVPQDHIDQFNEDQLKYELEPYRHFAPEWIRNWDGPFYVEQDAIMPPAPFTSTATGVLHYENWELQNPNLMDSTDPDTTWYATHSSHAVAGPFDTLDEAFEFITAQTSKTQ